MPKSIFIEPKEVFAKSKIPVSEIPINTYDRTLEQELGNYSTADFLQIWQDLCAIREFETILNEISTKGSYKGVAYNHAGPAHLSIGQEVAAVGMAFSLGPEDFIFGSHRSHGEILAKGFFSIRKLSESELSNILESYRDGAMLRPVENQFQDDPLRQFVCRYARRAKQGGACAHMRAPTRQGSVFSFAQMLSTPPISARDDDARIRGTGRSWRIWWRFRVLVWFRASVRARFRGIRGGGVLIDHDECKWDFATTMAFSPAPSCAHEIVTEWPKLHSLDGDSSATLQAMTAQTIPEYLEEECQKTVATQLRAEEEAARIQPLQHGHHRKAKQPRLPLLPQVKAATKKRKTVAVARKRPRAARKIAAKTRKTA